jgi:hypothetical protein
MRNFMTNRMPARARLAAGAGSALGVARRFGFYGHHDRLIVGGHVLDH